MSKVKKKVSEAVTINADKICSAKTLFRRQYKDFLLESKYHSVLSKSVKAYYPRNRLVVISEIKELFKDYPNHKDLLLFDLKFDIEQRVEEWELNWTKAHTTRKPTQIGIDIFKQKTAGAKEILAFLNSLEGGHINTVHPVTNRKKPKKSKPVDYDPGSKLEEILLFDPKVLKKELKEHGYFKGGSFVGNNESDRLKAGGKTGAGLDFVALCRNLCGRQLFGDLTMEKNRGQIAGAMQRYLNYSIGSYWDRWSSSISEDRVKKFDFLGK